MTLCLFRTLDNKRLMSYTGRGRGLGEGAYPVLAAGVFKWAEHERAAAVVLHVIGQVLAGDVGCAALVGALDREAGAVVLVVLELGRKSTTH